MQFGQGLIKSHPYIYKQINALNSNNVESFDKGFFAHIGLVTKAFSKSLFYYFTRAKINCQSGEFARYRQKLTWVSAEFTLLTNVALGILGPNLKQRENISARFGDILSYSYLITATLREFENNPKEEDKILVDYVCNYCFNEIQKAREELVSNLGYIGFLLPLVKVNPFGTKAADKLNAKIVASLSNKERLKDLTKNIFISKNKKDRFTKLQDAVLLNKESEASFKTIKKAIKNETIKKAAFDDMVKELEEKELLSKEEIVQVKKAHKIKQEVIAVDSFKVRAYKAAR
jgi:acyl-CoA dehydrogenase